MTPTPALRKLRETRERESKHAEELKKLNLFELERRLGLEISNAQEILHQMRGKYIPLEESLILSEKEMLTRFNDIARYEDTPVSYYNGHCKGKKAKEEYEEALRTLAVHALSKFYVLREDYKDIPSKLKTH